MSQLREQTQDNESEEDTKEDLSEDSKEDLSEDSKEDLSEDSKENLDEDSKEDLSEDSEEELEEDSDKDLDEDLDEELKEDSNEGLDEDQPIDLDLGDVRLNIDPSLSDLDSLDPNTNEDKESINLDLSDARLNIDPSLSDLGSLDPDTKEGISTEPIDLDLGDARLNFDPSLSDLGSLDPDTSEGKELIDLDLGYARINFDPSLSDLGSLDPDTSEGKELIDFDLSDARVNIDPSLSDLGSLDLDTKEGISTEPIELDHSDINPYIDDNEGTITSLLIKRDKESNHMSELNVRLSDMDSELVSELQGDSDVQDIARDELSGLDAELLEMDDISSSEFREVPVIQDVLKDELSELDGELSELEDISSYELKETPVIQDMLEDELSELDGELSEIDDITSRELQEAPVIQDVLEDELSELDGELSLIKDISSSDFQDSKITQNIVREEIKDELMKLDNESWDLKDMFLNEFVDLSETQYSLEEDSLEISNAMEPVALDIANVHTKTLGQDYVGEPQIENVYEEGNENEINYDLSIDKNNQEASEQELSLIGKENGEESREITATTSSTTSTDQKENQEDIKEEEQVLEQEKENQMETDYNTTGFTDQTLNLKQRLGREFGGFIDQRKNLDERLRREFRGQVEDKDQDIQKDEPEQELSLIGKESGEESKEITATTSSTTSTVQKDNQEDDKESEPTSERNEESLNNNDIKDTKKSSENLNNETEEEVKLEGEGSEDLEDLIDKAIGEFKILKDPKLKEMIKKHDGIAYKGNHFTKKFIKFIKDQDNDALTRKEKDNLVKRIDEFNENRNINNLLRYYIKYTKISQNKIIEKLEDMNLNISKYTLSQISHKILTGEEYKKRFLRPQNWVPDEQREGIIKAGRSTNPGSLRDIGNEFGVPDSTVGNIIRKDLGEKVYHKKFPKSADWVSDEQREGIIKAGRSKDPDSINKIAETWGVAHGTARDILKKDLGEKVYHKKFPKPPEVSDEQREGIIKAGRSKNPGSLRDIGNEFGVPDSTVGNIIRKDLAEKVYHKKFPKSADWVSDEQREGIIKAGRSTNPGSLTDIANEFGVPDSTVGNIIRKDLGKEEFNKKFHNDISQSIGLENHQLIEKIATKDFDEKRKKSPNVPILISEPNIYTNSKKCCDNAFKNDKKYLQKLLKDKIAKELKIDPKKFDHIKVVLFDYTGLLIKNNIINKIEKYQHSKIMLFIVGTHWFQSWVSRVKKLPKDKRIKYPENIRIIKWDLFADLLNLSDDNRKRLKEIIKLSGLRDLETLKNLNEQNNYKLHRLKKSKTKKKGSKNNLDAFLSKI